MSHYEYALYALGAYWFGWIVTWLLKQILRGLGVAGRGLAYVASSRPRNAFVYDVPKCGIETFKSIRVKHDGLISFYTINTDHGESRVSWGNYSNTARSFSGCGMDEEKEQWLTNIIVAHRKGKVLNVLA